MRSLPAVVLVSLACGSPTLASAAWGGCAISEPRQASVEAGGAELVRVIAKAGSLEIMGKEGLTDVRAHGKACAEHREDLAEVRLVAERSGSEVRVEVVTPDGWGKSGSLDLVVEVPQSLAVAVEDGSGSAEIRGVASLRLKDGSGEIEVRDVAGDVEVRDGSGKIEIVQVRGSVVVDDGSGSIEIQDVEGSVTIESDGSGSIDVTGAKKSVLVRRDGSGGISVKDVAGDFVVERDGSGSVTHSGVQGRVDVPSR